MRKSFTPAVRAALTAGLLVLAGAGHAQDAARPPGGILGGIFGGGNSSQGGSQVSDSDLVVRLDRLERQVRQLTGEIERLQFRNQQLEQALQRIQPGAVPASQPGAPASPRGALPQPSAPQQATGGEPAGTAPPAGERRGDVFNPALHPDAPGAPRPLGGSASIAAPEPRGPSVIPDAGVPGGRQPGAPLDLSNLSTPPAPGADAPAGGAAASPNGAGVASLPPPPPRNPSATGALSAVQPPTHSPKDEYDLAYGYLLRKDYALAEAAFKTFLRDHPSDRLAADATYWLGESMFQRQRFRDAAESFLAVPTKHEKSGKAPDALYRLGQSLASMGEKEAACAALGEVGRKYPRASASVKQGVVRDQKRVHC